MYALKKITTTLDGRQVEEVSNIGDWYRLEFHSNNPLLVASIEYSKGGNFPVIEIARHDEAYITTLTGETVRCVCRGDYPARAGSGV